MSLRGLQHTKSNRIEISKGVPSPNEGNNGELRLGITSKGIFLYAKYGNRWYQLGDAAISSSGQFPTQSIASQGGGKLATSIDRGDESLRMGGKIILGDNVITQQGSSSGVKFDSSENLTLDSANNLVLDAANANGGQGLQFLLNGTKVGDITGHHANTYFTLYENAGASTSDYFAIKCGANGDSDIITVDATGATAHLNITPDGQLTLNPVSTLTFQPTGTLMIRKSMFQQEQASADADQVAYGQIWVKNATPNELYFTNDAGNDIQITSGSSMAGGGGGGTSYWIQQWGARAYTKNLNWYRPNSTYGIAYYNWNTNTSSTSLPSTWSDSNNPMIVVPKDCTLKEYNFTGNFSSSQTYEVALLKGTGVTYGSAGDYTLSNVGTTQSQAATGYILYSLGETGLSVSLSKGDMLVPFVRRTTLDSVSQFYFELSFSIVCEIS